MKYSLVIFDLDGTLMDSSEGILGAIKKTTKTLNLPELSHAEMLSFIGPPPPISFRKHYGLDGEELDATVATFRQFYSDEFLTQAKVYDGIYDVFEFCKKNNIQTAVATYKKEDYAIRLLKHYNFDKYTDIMFGADAKAVLTKKDIMQKCIDKAEISDHSKILMVGDSTNDYVGAMDLGVDFVGVNWGFGFKKGEVYDDLPKTIAFIDEATELINIINQK
jgi:phosphoglycolate phosphatase